MKLVKKTSEYKIRQRRDGRYAVTNPLGNAITGDEKVKILVAEKLIVQKTPNNSEESESQTS